MFRPLLLAVALLAAINPFAKADLLSFVIAPAPDEILPGQPGYRTVSFETYTYELYPTDAYTSGNPDPTTYFSPSRYYDNRFTEHGLQVTRTYVDGQGVAHTTSDTENVTFGYASGYMESADPGEYIVGGGGGPFSTFYTGTLFPGASAAVPMFLPGTYYDEDRVSVLTIKDLTTAATPEPSSMVLAGGGLLSGLGMVFRRRRTVA